MPTIPASRGVGLHKPNPAAVNPKTQTPTSFLGKKLKFRHPTSGLASSVSSRGHLITVCGIGFEVVDAARDLFVGVGLPFTVMECGDIIYRSTLPKSNEITLTAPGVVLALGALSYLWATPGVAPVFFDMFVLAFFERIFRPTYKKKDGELVLKKASEFGAVEIWMNERVRRACGNSCADFLYGFLETSSKNGPQYWLLWRFEGEDTLADLMQSKEFPYNVGAIVPLHISLFVCFINNKLLSVA